MWKRWDLQLLWHKLSNWACKFAELIFQIIVGDIEFDALMPDNMPRSISKNYVRENEVCKNFNSIEVRALILIKLIWLCYLYHGYFIDYKIFIDKLFAVVLLLILHQMWRRSHITGIAKLSKKYKLSSDEVAFIESIIKIMALK